MAKLALLILILAIILSLVSNSSINPSNNYNKQCLDGPHVLFQTAGNIQECHKCHNCPLGKGMTVNCIGQIVSSVVNIECVDCVPGANYSITHDHQRCISCPKVCENQETHGKCLADADNRKCIPCKKAWYFGKVDEKCLPCSCHNMSVEAQEKCHADGFSFDQCRQPATNLTSPGSTDKGDGNSWKVLEILFLIGGLISALIFFRYLYFLGKRFCKFRENNEGCPDKNECIKIIVCCPYSVADSDSSTPTSEGGTRMHDNLQSLVDSPNTRCHFGRQNSCPADFLRKKLDPFREVDSMENTPLVIKLQRDCLRERKKVFDLDAEVCRKLYILLKKGNDTGIGYTTLAGLMGYTGGKVDEFELTDDPAKSLVLYWSKTESNNVLKFIGLVNCLRRDDIAKLLKDALPECECERCLLV